MSFNDIKVVIENDLGCKIEDIFSSFDKEPIAAASLAQVHRAVLRSNNQEVAVKIQFPTLKLQTKYDMIVASHWISIIDKVAYIIDFKGVDLK